jgi:ABC-type nitrate/sulfonate/bicarbonate transport system substrate-binding protein
MNTFRSGNAAMRPSLFQCRMTQPSGIELRWRQIAKGFFPAMLLLALVVEPSFANPYLARAGEKRLHLRIATCAVSGGFAHLYAALENNLFVKYGFRMEHVFIRGSEPALSALAAGEIHFLYCAGEATLPAMASGMDIKLVATPLVKPPHVLVTRKGIRRVEDLQGKTLGVGRAGDLSDRLSRALVKKLNVPDVKIRAIGGSQTERYQSLAADIVQGVVITPPLDVRAKIEGFHIAYRLIDLDIPFVYSSVHTASNTVRKQPEVVQRMVAAFAESIRFVDQNPVKAKSAISKVMRVKDPESLQVAYDVYTKEIVDRRMMVPENAVADTIERTRKGGNMIKRKPEDLYDQRFTTQLEKGGFLKELWGAEVPVR